MRRLLFGERNSVGRRLIVLIIAFSSLITLAISVAQLLFEYHALRDDMERELDGVAIHVPGLAASVWNFDDQQVRVGLEALTRLPNIDRVNITTANGDKHWMAGGRLSPNIVTRSYPLRREAAGKTMTMGTLEVVASLDAIYRQVGARALTIVLSNGLKTFLVALFMVVLLRRLVTGRLEALANQVRALAPSLLPMPQAAQTAPQQIPAHLDEVDAVRWTLDATTRNLGTAVTALQDLNLELEARVAERTKALAEANKDLEAFSYSLSHDLRSPLRTIGGFATILQEDNADRLDAEGVRHLGRIVAASRRMDVLIEDTLRFFKASAGALQREPVDLSAIARDIAEQLAQCDAARHVEWNIQDGMTTQGDPGLLRTVLENLLGNAWKYTGKRDGARIAMGTSVGAAGTPIYFVADNGAGFDMKYASRLFVPFQRIHGEDEFPGTGVGLATVQKIVHRHGGDIWAEAAPQQGAKFLFTLA